MSELEAWLELDLCLLLASVKQTFTSEDSLEPEPDLEDLFD